MPVGDISTSRANRALDAANFFLADVRDGLGPYLSLGLSPDRAEMGRGTDRHRDVGRDHCRERGL